MDAPPFCVTTPYLTEGTLSLARAFSFSEVQIGNWVLGIPTNHGISTHLHLCISVSGQFHGPMGLVKNRVTNKKGTKHRGICGILLNTAAVFTVKPEVGEHTWPSMCSLKKKWMQRLTLMRMLTCGA